MRDFFFHRYDPLHIIIRLRIVYGRNLGVVRRTRDAPVTKQRCAEISAYHYGRHTFRIESNNLNSEKCLEICLLMA